MIIDEPQLYNQYYTTRPLNSSKYFLLLKKQYSEAIKLIEENIGSKLLNIDLGNGFFVCLFFLFDKEQKAAKAK